MCNCDVMIILFIINVWMEILYVYTFYIKTMNKTFLWFNFVLLDIGTKPRMG